MNFIGAKDRTIGGTLIGEVSEVPGISETDNNTNALSFSVA